MLTSYVGQAEGAAPSHYYEVDFPEVTRKKAAIIANREALQRLVGQKIDAQAIGDVTTPLLHMPGAPARSLLPKFSDSIYSAIVICASYTFGVLCCLVLITSWDNTRDAI